jgi:hypothetical protein
MSAGAGIAIATVVVTRIIKQRRKRILVGESRGCDRKDRKDNRRFFGMNECCLKYEDECGKKILARKGKTFCLI